MEEELANYRAEPGYAMEFDEYVRQRKARVPA
jgi:hypothetical protein